MEPTTDHDLLAEYRRGSEDAFAQLVRRHIAWVHSIARRRVRDAHLADDVTQATFIVLARKAAELRPDTVLPAWLFRVTTYAATKAIRDESRRAAHETEAAMRRANVDQPSETGKDLALLLDDFVGRLRQKDREAILLRFYQRLSFAEVAAALRTTEEASRKRVARALEKLRGMAERAGQTVSTPTLAGAMATAVVLPTSRGLASLSIKGALAAQSSTATATATATAAAGNSIAEGVIQMMTFAKLKFAAAAMVTISVLAGTSSYVVRHAVADTAQAASPSTAAPAAIAPSRVAVAVAVAPNTAARVLHFPKDRSLGMLSVLDVRIERKIQDFYHHVDGTGMEWQYLGEARGDVSVPAGKKVSLRVSNASGRDLSPLTRLAADDLYQLYLAETSDGESLSHLASLSGLKVLAFSQPFTEKQASSFTPEDLEHLRPLKSLERLTVPDHISDRGLAAVVESLPRLRAVYFMKNDVTDSGLAVLSKLRALEELSVGGDNITGSGLAALSDLPSLHYVYLWGRAANDEALRAVRTISSLKTFNAPESVTDDGLAHLAGHPGLEALSLFNTKVTDRGVAHLVSLPALRKLDLTKREFDRAHPPITDAATVTLKMIKTLEDLRLPAEGLTDTGLTNLAELANLKALSLPMAHNVDRKRYLNPYTDKGINELAKLRSLESLFIAGPGVTDEALAHVARLTDLRSLSLFGCPVSDEGLARLKRLRSLESFTLMNGGGVTVAGLNHLNGLTHLTHLQSDVIARDATVLDIGGLNGLEYLMLSPSQGSTLRDEDLACLASLKKLKSLQLGGTKLQITDTGMAHLAGHTALERVVLGGAGVTDRSLAVLGKLPRLDLLRIGGAFTDAGLQRLENLSGLQSLSIYSATAISPAAQARLRKATPNLQRLSVEQVANSHSSSHPKPGTPAPDFTVTTLDGTAFTLAQQQGKVVLLHFWGTWCSPCIKNLPGHRAVHASLKRKYGDRVVLIDLVMDDTDTALHRLVAEHKLTTPQATIGMWSKIADSYGVVSAPDDFMIGPDGRILLNRESPESAADTERLIDKALGLK